MLMIKRAVAVHKTPQKLSSANKAELLHRLEMSFEQGHPRFVLDCSQWRTVGSDEIHLLLCCLEEAMKHKGDVRLAAVQPDAEAVLRSVGVDRLFEIYGTAEQAVSSYDTFSSDMPFLGLDSVEMGTEYAASSI